MYHIYFVKKTCGHEGLEKYFVKPIIISYLLKAKLYYNYMSNIITFCAERM